MLGVDPSCVMPCAPCSKPSQQTLVSKLYGVYDFAHPNGAFEVHLRSKGRFYAPKFPEKSVWTCTNECCSDGKTCCQLQIEWGKYGRYQLDMDMGTLPPCCSGSLVGNPKSWRKMTMKRPFTSQEMKLMDSEWELEHPGGSFAIQFHADGLNSFMCAAFPAKAYWRIEGVESDTPIIYINWGKYGEYELTMAADGESMAGSAKGKPEKWRKATRIRGLDEMLWKKRGREGCGGCKKGCGECGRDED